MSRSMVELFESLGGRADLAASELEPLLERVVSDARAAWPGVSLSTENFFKHLVERQPEESVGEWLASAATGDLYLACACAASVPGALEAFERQLMAPVAQTLARKGYAREMVDEVCQEVREKMFIASAERPPRIRAYAGQSGLLHWLRVVAARAAIDVRRRQPQLAQSSSVPDDESEDPELDFIKSQYRREFKQAVQSAIADLSTEQRNLLRLHFVEGATLQELASLFQVHRATISRQIAAAREEILDHTRRRLTEALRAEAADLANLFALLKSRLDLSISRVLDNDPD
jgi:RNA polymerase sigma-70 factor